MIFNIHAGHNPDGKIGCGAIGLIKESTEARNVRTEVCRQLQVLGHTVYDCTCDNGTSQNDVLSKIVAKCNSHRVDLDVSIHFNCGANDKKGNGVTAGTEVYVYNRATTNRKACNYALNVVNSISALGFKNRGVKENSSLYFLRKTTAPAILIECCFVDDADDVKLYDAKKIASAIVYGLTGQKVTTETPKKTESSTLYRVQVGSFKDKKNAKNLITKLKKAGFSGIIVKG